MEPTRRSARSWLAFGFNSFNSKKKVRMRLT
jgi:hypothetical protein